MWGQAGAVLVFWASLSLKTWIVNSKNSTINYHFLKEVNKGFILANTQNQRKLTKTQVRDKFISSTCAATALAESVLHKLDPQASLEQLPASSISVNSVKHTHRIAALHVPAQRRHPECTKLQNETSGNKLKNIKQSSDFFNLGHHVTDEVESTLYSGLYKDWFTLISNYLNAKETSLDDEHYLHQFANLIHNYVLAAKKTNSFEFLAFSELLNNIVPKSNFMFHDQSLDCAKIYSNCDSFKLKSLTRFLKAKSAIRKFDEKQRSKSIHKSRTHNMVNTTKSISDNEIYFMTNQTTTTKTLKGEKRSYRILIKDSMLPIARPVTVAHAVSTSSILKIVPVIVAGPSGLVEIYALLDDGSSVTLIDQEVVEYIGAEGPKGVIKVSGVSGLAKTSEVSYVTIGIKGKYTNTNFTLHGVQAISNLGIVNQTILMEDLVAYPHLKDLANELSYIDARPRLVIGIDNWHLSLPREVRKGTKDQPVAVKTALGWTVFGQIIDRSATESIFKVLPVTVSGPKESMDVYALIDEGSTVSMIEKDVADVIGAEGPIGLISIQGVGGLTKDTEVSFVTISIKGKFSNDSYTLHNVQSIPDLGISAQTVLIDDIMSFPYLKDIADQLIYEEATPTIIIGIDNWHLTLAREIRRGSKNQPIAVRTALGWTVFGKLSGRGVPTKSKQINNEHRHPIIGIPTL